MCGEEGHLARDCPHKDRQKQTRRLNDRRQRKQVDTAGIDGKDKAERKQRKFDRAFAAAFKRAQESQSESEAELEDSGAESDDASDSGRIRAHAARMYSCLTDR